MASTGILERNRALAIESYVSRIERGGNSPAEYIAYLGDKWEEFLRTRALHVGTLPAADRDADVPPASMASDPRYFQALSAVATRRP